VREAEAKRRDEVFARVLENFGSSSSPMRIAATIARDGDGPGNTIKDPNASEEAVENVRL